MKGTIVFYNEERGFGFIDVPGEVEHYWFHISEVIAGRDSVHHGAVAQFEPATYKGRNRGQNVEIVEVQPRNNKDTPRQKRMRRTSFTPDYSGTWITIDEDEMHECLREISNWKLEAKLEDVVKYFCPMPEIDNLIGGRKSYVIGRKGTGKTALVEYISDNTGTKNGVTSRKLTFKNFPFNELYRLDNDSYTRPNQYISIWKYIIYSYAVRAMIESHDISEKIKKRIRKVYPEPDSMGLKNLLGRWTSGDFSINILGSGLSFGNWFKRKEATTWQERVDHLEAFIKENADDRTYLILFDELDEDYKDILSKPGRQEYIDLLTSLFKSIQDIRSVMDKAGKNIFPVIFLRDDIYDIITDSDKNKWRDLTTYLDWNTSDIQNLLKYRLSVAANINGSTFNEVWYSIFDNESIPYSGGRKSLHSFDYIARSTQGRPRDFIHYLQVCAENQLSRGGGRIRKQTVQDADKAYSNYLRSELVDEMHGLVADVGEIFRLFTQIRKWIMSIDEFRSMHEKYTDSGIVTTKDADFVLQILFYFSVIGNVSRQQKVHIFRHENPEAVLNFHENIVIHRGLMKALQIL